MNSRALPKLYVIADFDFAGGIHAFSEYLSILAQAARQFESRFAIQVRAKNLPPEAMEHFSRSARRVVGREALLILNGPEKLALECGYDGVHWPESQIPDQPSDLSSLNFRSAAVHSVRAVQRAERANATALVYSPVFRPNWKSTVPAGLSALAQATRATPLPVYALGGITPARVGACKAAGAYGVAVLSSLADAKQPINACAEYLDNLY